MSIFAKGGSLTRVLSIMLVAVMVLGLFGSFGVGPVQSNSLVAYAEETETGTTANKDLFDSIVGNDGTITEPTGGNIQNMNDLVVKAKSIASIILALCAVVCLIFMIINITKLPQSADNEQMRRKALSGILWSGIGVALLGGSSVVVGFFWGLLNTV